MLKLKSNPLYNRARKRISARRGFTVRLQIERLEDRNLLAIAGTPNQNFIAQAYLDLLHRQVDPAGLTFWTGLVDQGTSRTQVVRDIQTSLEFRTDEIDNAYQTLLGRSADPAGFNGMLARRAGGATIDQINEVVYGSAEFFQHSGATNEGFLDNLYLNLLGRAIDSGGDAGWNLVLTSGISRQEVATLISNGSEYAQHQVQFLYKNILHRNADSGGLSAFAAEEASLGIDGISAIMIGSAEYFQAVRNNPPGIPGTHATTLTLTASPSSSVPLNTPVTITASLAPFADNLNTTDGQNVTFMLGGNTLGTGTLKNGGASFTTDPTKALDALTAGNHTFTAVYQGDRNFAASNSAAVQVSVSMEATTLGVISLAPPNSNVNTPIQFHATLAFANQGAVTPGGTVTFEDVSSATILGNPISVTGLVVTSDAVKLSPVGPHTIEAIYSGDANFMGITSPSITQTISNKPAPVVAVSSSSANNTSNLGDAVTFTATLTVPQGVNVVPTGNVNFVDQGTGTTIASATLTAGTTVAISSPITSLTGGSHQIVAEYQGDSNFSGSSSQAIMQTVTPAPITVTLGSPTFGNPGNLPNVPGSITATLSGAVNGFALTGQLMFSLTDGSGTVVAQQSGPASKTTFSFPGQNAGSYTISARYTGDANYTSTQPSTPVTVAKGTVSAAVTQVVQNGDDGDQGATFTIAVSTNDPLATLAGGNLAIVVNGVTITTQGGVAVTGATITFNAPGVIPDLNTGVGSGNLNYKPSAASTIQLSFTSSDKNYGNNPNAGSNTATFNDADDGVPESGGAQPDFFTIT
jgi:hypothetical protein